MYRIRGAALLIKSMSSKIGKGGYVTRMMPSFEYLPYSYLNDKPLEKPIPQLLTPARISTGITALCAPPRLLVFSFLTNGSTLILKTFN